MSLEIRFPSSELAKEWETGSERVGASPWSTHTVSDTGFLDDNNFPKETPEVQKRVMALALSLGGRIV